MKASYSWLKDYVDAKIDPKKLAHLLTMAGINVASCENIGGDYIFEFEITANRPDCLSIIGIAREVAALLGKNLKIPKELHANAKIKSAKKEKAPLSIVVKDAALCPRYTARIIKNVEVGPSPDWLKERIISVGLRPVNNIVDITNFVLFETGQPMHAFDLDRLKGNISVRTAAKNEKIITIDNASRLCNGDTLVIADESGPIAIGGVMGGLGTEVNNMTKNILLESAFFNPVSVRRTARRLGISSESSYRFERRIDNSMVVNSSERASALIAEIAGGEIEGFIAVGKKTSYSKIVNLDLEKINKILGISVKKEEATKILKTLGFSVENKKTYLKVTVPSFREDVKNDIDITEEIVRIYGYEKIPLTIPRIVGNVAVKDSKRIFRENLSQRLTRLGLSEIITYSLISKNNAIALGIPENKLIHIANPLSIDQEIMRPTLLPGALKVISHNLNRRAKRLAFFEIGKSYKEKESLYMEEPVLSIALAGTKEEHWNGKKEDFNFFDIKGIFEKLLEDLGINKITFKKTSFPGLDQNTASSFESDGVLAGYLGEVSTNVCKKFDVEKKVFYGELYIKPLFQKAKLEKKYSTYGKYPAITRDISILSDRGVTSHEIISIIKDTGKALVKSVSMTGSYKGKQVPEGKKALLYRIEYRSHERTLEDKEVDQLESQIKTTLSEKLNISFR